MLRLVNSAFGLPHENLSKAALLRNLEAFFRARRAEGKRVLLVIDEAQNLSKRAVEELRMLSNYQEGGQALMQSFLLGQVELKRTLQGPGMEQVRQRIIAGYHLRPLGQDELQHYIEHRLALLYTHGVGSGRLELGHFVDLVSTRPAKLFGLYPRKGEIEAGSDADLVLWDPVATGTISAATHHHRCDRSIYEGFHIQGLPSAVVAGGRVRYREGNLDVERGAGRFLRRAPVDQGR